MKAQSYTAHLLVKSSMQLGEGAYWSDRLCRFLFVDILGKKMGHLDPESPDIVFFETKEFPGTVVVDENNCLISAQKGKIIRLNLHTHEETELHKVEPDLTGNRCNDGKCDPAGRLWLGTMDMKASSGKGNLYSFDGKSLVLRLSGTSISNGICWSADKQTMYYIDTALQNIQAFDYDILTGNITHPRVLITIPAGEGAPDGMVIDRDGNLWIALWGGGCVKCYDPRTGETLATVGVDAPLVSSCALGGKNGNQLLITTARDGMTDEELEKYPLSGSLFIAEVKAKKAEIYEFNSII